MAFEALLNDTLILAENYDVSEWIELQSAISQGTITLTSPFCEHKLHTVRSSSKVRQHFSHYPKNSDCDYNTLGESLTHLALKQAVAELAVESGGQSLQEEQLGRTVRNDITVWSPKHCYALEIQLSDQTHSEYLSRTLARKTQNRETIWLTTHTANLSIPNVTTFFITDIPSLVDFKTKEEYIKKVKENVKVKIYSNKSLSSELFPLKSFIREILFPESNETRFSFDTFKDNEEKKSERFSHNIARSKTDLPYYANLSCVCKRSNPSTDYATLSETEIILIQAAELELVEKLGSDWCHRGDENPFMRLTIDDIGVHRTIGEMIEHGYVLNKSAA